MNCFYLTMLILFAVFVDFTNIGNSVMGEERTPTTRTRTQIALELLDMMDNNDNVRRMNLIKTAAILKGLHDRINEKQVISPLPISEKFEPDPELLKSKKREIFGTLYMKYLTFRSLLHMILCRTFFTYVRKNEEAAMSCTEAMDAIARFYEGFNIDDHEVERIFPATSDVAHALNKNYVRVKELMKEPKFSFPVTNLIRNAHKIPNVEEKFREIMTQKMAAEKRRVNDISSAASESGELIECDELEFSAKCSQITAAETDVLELRLPITATNNFVKKKLTKNESVIDESILQEESLTQSNEFSKAYDLSVLEAMNPSEEHVEGDKNLRELRPRESSAPVDQNKYPGKVEALKKKFRHQAISELHKIIWEEALSNFGNFMVSTENFFNETLNRRESILTSIHDMIPNDVKEFIPYWTYIARQAVILPRSNNADGDSSLKKMRSYLMEAEMQKREILNYERAPVAKITILLNSKRFSDFTVVF